MEGAHRAALLSEPGRVAAHALFFPAAAAYAALVLPASVLAMLGIVPALPGSGFAAGHAHEMLFGFALAVVAGDQLGPTNPRVLALLFGSWIAARAAFLFAPYGIATALANAAFATLLAARLVPRLFASAKKLRNRALPFVLAALCACALAIQIALQLGSAGTQHGVLMVAIVLIGLLMLFMGGRIIAPAAGQLHAQGGNLGARVQPRLEGWLIVLMLAAAAAIAVGAASPGGIALVGAGALAAARLARWRLWALRGRPDILCLGAGYAWLALGLIALGAALLAGKHVVAALHLITVGSLGT
ncbi:MAG: NnrS family protein, partial [Usitatibacter sp.]